MKRLHVSVSVTDLEESVAFYATLFGAEPTVRKSDYAKWMLDDPRVNFAIAQVRGRAVGVDHLGVQVETADELTELADRLKAAAVPHRDQPDANCCYALSDKTWVRDPQGVSWETFHTKGAITRYGEDTRVPLDEDDTDPRLADHDQAEAAPASCC